MKTLSKSDWAILGLAGLTALAVGCGPADDDNPLLDCQLLVESAINGGVTLGAGTCYQVDHRLTLSSGVLRIEPGVRLTFAQDAGIAVRDDGRLRAVGTAEKPVVFTGLESRRGFWRGLQFLDTRSDDNRLEHAVIEFAGSSKWHGGEQSQAGLFVYGNGVQLTLRNTTLRANLVAAVTIDGPQADLVLDNNRYEDNVLPLRIAPNHVGSLTSAQTFEGNDGQFVLVDGFSLSRKVERAQTWHALAVPYQFAHVAVIEQPVTIEPGTVLEFRQNTGLQIEATGRLIANADGADKIVFKGAEDINGFWRGLYFYKSFSSENVLANTTVQHAGAAKWHGGEQSQANIFLRGGSDKAMLTVRNTEVTGSGKYGISVENEAVLSDCQGLEVSANNEDDFKAQANAVVCN
ncbi:MAG: hypothetical protein H0U74_04605 [Bradymonadaceae bacterium]|nr:hypothetical protein [Lujinxingiaceae bacterium]